MRVGFASFARHSAHRHLYTNETVPSYAHRRRTARAQPQQPAYACARGTRFRRTRPDLTSRRWKVGANRPSEATRTPPEGPAPGAFSFGVRFRGNPRNSAPCMAPDEHRERCASQRHGVFPPSGARGVAVAYAAVRTVTARYGRHLEGVVRPALELAHRVEQQTRDLSVAGSNPALPFDATPGAQAPRKHPARQR